MIIWREVLENHGPSSIVAFHAIFTCPNGSKVLYNHDIFLHYGDDANIPPAGSVEIVAADPSKCPGGVVSAIFSDGHSEGDPQEINGLYARRRGVYMALGESITLLGAIATQKETPEQVMDTLKRRAESLAYDQTIDGYERRGTIDIYDKLRFALQTTRGIVDAPSDHAANRQPSYSQLAKSQNISLEQAQAIIISKKFQEWRADLAGNMEPPNGK